MLQIQSDPSVSSSSCSDAPLSPVLEHRVEETPKVDLADELAQRVMQMAGVLWLFQEVWVLHHSKVGLFDVKLFLTNS